MRTSEFFSSGPQEVEEEEKPRRNKRAKISKNFTPDFLFYLFKNKSQSFKEVMPTLKASFQKEIINNEIRRFIMKNHT